MLWSCCWHRRSPFPYSSSQLASKISMTTKTTGPCRGHSQKKVQRGGNPYCWCFCCCGDGQPPSHPSPARYYQAQIPSKLILSAAVVRRRRHLPRPCSRFRSRNARSPPWACPERSPCYGCVCSAHVCVNQCSESKREITRRTRRQQQHGISCNRVSAALDSPVRKACL